MQKVGSLKWDFCQSCRKESRMNGETKQCLKSLLFLFYQPRPLWIWQRSGYLQSAQCCLHWAGMEDSYSSGKSSSRQTLLMNEALCVVTVWPSDFTWISRDYSSGSGFSNWKPLAWAAIYLFHLLPHSMHSCQMTEILLTLSAKTYFLQTKIFYLASPLRNEVPLDIRSFCLSMFLRWNMLPLYSQVCACPSFIYFCFKAPGQTLSSLTLVQPQTLQCGCNRGWNLTHCVCF